MMAQYTPFAVGQAGETCDFSSAFVLFQITYSASVIALDGASTCQEN